ncbi:ParB/RepB/Spo0J family partition protein (plasmid) [Streptomyces sp. QHH-9511]|uniref:ParB/RepB/Spo0J family partition protein n=1 Tax=Streptomyces sp. QHH-9511 TaxID=2684468 RepID=UPI001315FD6D|nr:ParB/RepB/Spo0J family partition protein [Streptomyces sp. QHH-9511]QGZ53402.1 ParB/RepB/Spo0J family partition protein [Streptomyces sp. QHH-9511]
MTSRAETLGPSSAFGAAAGARSARREIYERTMGLQPDPTKLPVTAISLNPGNPRSELGNLTDLANSLRDHGQKTAISIMSREAYLAAEPNRAAELEPGTQYVVIEGNSRLAAAREAGLPTIKVMVDDSLGSDSDSILESALVANVHRNELAHLDEARALARLLKIHGTQEALAARLHRSQTWVSHRLALLNLTPELQERLENGEESPDLLKKVGSKKPEEQQAHLDRLKEKRAAEAAARKAAKANRAAPAPKPMPPVEKGPDGGTNWAKPEDLGNAFLPKAPAAKQPSDTDVVAQESETPAPAPSPAPVPDPRPSGASSTGVPVMPWKDGVAVMDIALKAMDDQQRSRLIHRYFAVADPDAVAAAMRETCSPAEREEFAGTLAKVAALLTQD